MGFMTARLEQLFADRTLVRPSDDRINLVHVVRAIATITGASDFRHSSCVRQVLKLVGEPEHLIFVLLDGLGMSTVRLMPEDSFIRSHLRDEIAAGCPSTTACALTTVATAEYANCHGVTGWFTYLPELELTATMLPFHDRFTHIPLGARGIKVADVLQLPPICGKMKRDVLTVVPAFIRDTPYNNFARAGTRGVGYLSFRHAFDEVITHIVAATGPTYTHVYLPEIDSQCHKAGVCHSDVMPLVMKIDSELKRLAGTVEGRAKIVVSADHGLIDVPRNHQHFLSEGDPLLEMLHVPPTGDARMPVFHVRSDRRAVFAELFQKVFGEEMVLITKDQAEQMELFGCGQWSAWAKPRFGDFIAIPYRPATLSYHAANKPMGSLFQAVHGGMSPEEMEIPLCVA
jgi:hypothetical protein